MKLRRRQFLQFAGLAATLPAAARATRTQSYPSRPVRLITGCRPGSAYDETVHAMAQWLSRRLGEPFIVENGPGANTSSVAAEALARSPADGHTLLMVSTRNAIRDALSFGGVRFDVRRDIVPVASVVRDPMVIAIDPSFPARSFPEFVRYARARPYRNWMVMKSVGIGSGVGVAGALNIVARIDLLHQACAADAVEAADLRGRWIQVFIGTATAMATYVNAGKLRALAVTAPTRIEALPDVPTVAETIPGYQASDWFGFGAPKGTPADIIEALNRAINAGLSDPGVRSWLTALGRTPLPDSAGDFANLVADETEHWNRQLKFGGRTVSTTASGES